jgi:hypothetical protein
MRLICDLIHDKTTGLPEKGLLVATREDEMSPQADPTETQCAQERLRKAQNLSMITGVKARPQH